MVQLTTHLRISDIDVTDITSIPTVENLHAVVAFTHDLVSGDEIPDRCTLLGDSFGYMIQFLLGIMAFSTLIYKRHRERPMRPFGTWSRDTSKQALGSFACHFVNILFADVLVSGEAGGDACLYYLLNFLSDLILGVGLCYCLLILVEYIANYTGNDTLNSGYYGDPPSLRTWAIQASVWVGIVITSKLILLFSIMLPLKHVLYASVEWCFRLLIFYPKIELSVVMVFIPVIGNCISFWVQDDILMCHQKSEEPLDSKQSWNRTIRNYFQAERDDQIKNEPFSEVPEPVALPL